MGRSPVKACMIRPEVRIRGTFFAVFAKESMKQTLLFLVLCAPLVAQRELSPKLSYDAASIKPSDPNQFATRIMIGGGQGGRFSANGMTVRQMIVQAYGIQDFQLTGGPGWIGSDRFDIEATPPPGVSITGPQNQEMLQSLLEERFQLKLRRETKPLPGYSLLLAKNGSKMKPSADQTPLSAGGPPPPGAPPVGGPVAITRAGGPAGPGGPGGPIIAGPPSRGMVRMGLGNISGGAMQMAQLTQILSRQLGRTVVDNTGLTGLFDVELNFTPERTPPQGTLPPGVVQPQIDPDGPTIFTALQEQLGLRLESTTQPGDMLTIEKIEKPSEN